MPATSVFRASAVIDLAAYASLNLSRASRASILAFSSARAVSKP